MTDSVMWIPIVGGLIGLAVAAVYAGIVSIAEPILASTVAIASGVILTGALHEDGLADTADAFGGGRGRDEIMRIFKDPAHGSYGGLALVLSVVIRAAALSSLSVVTAFILLPAVHALSRGAAIGLMAVLAPATDDGLGAAHSQPGVRARVGAGLALAVAVGSLTLGWWVVIFALAAASAAATIGVMAHSKIQGFTGDVLGATQQVAEMVLLVIGASMALGGRFFSVGWWQ
jgi:adenosylcobinamide-GDP ribazoletransferase